MRGRETRCAVRILVTVFLVMFMDIPWAAGQDAPPAKVVVAKVTQEEIAENQSFIGLIYYDRISRVSSEVSGLVEEITVREGDRVEPGEVLVRLNTDILDKEIEHSRTRIEQIALRIEHAEKNYRRLDTLFAQDGVSEKEYEDASYAYQDYIKEKKAAEEERAILLIKKEKSVIKAPFAGVILEKGVDTGDWVQQGRELVRIASVNDLYVKVPVAETVLQYVTFGSEVGVTINAFNEQISGMIEDFSPIADAKTKNVFLKVRIPPQQQVAENMSATVFVPTSIPKKLSMIPRDALVKFQGKDFVYTVKEDKAAILPINIVTYAGKMVGADNPYFVPGMAVVVEGNERLRPDQAVVVTGEK